jgi:putative copper resistance protein D
MIDLLVAARGVHFASTAVVAGVALFRYLIAEPAFQTGEVDSASLQAYRDKLNACMLIGLALAVFSGAVWLTALAITIGAQNSLGIVSTETVWLLLTETQFGHVSLPKNPSALD